MILDGPGVALDPSVVDVDVARFERLVADGRPEALEQNSALRAPATTQGQGVSVRRR
jgi:hypothetical protein